MKKIPKILIPMLVLATLLIGACTGAPSPAADTSGGSKVESAPVEFTGVIESIEGDQWVINGQTVMVDSAVVNDGPFTIGDTVKVEADVQADGTILVKRVELPAAAVVASEAAAIPPASATPAPSVSSATPDPTLISGDNSNANSNTNMDDNGNNNGDDSGYDDNGGDDSDSGGSDDSGGDN